MLLECQGEYFIYNSRRHSIRIIAYCQQLAPHHHDDTRDVTKTKIMKTGCWLFHITLTPVETGHSNFLPLTSVNKRALVSAVRFSPSNKRQAASLKTQDSHDRDAILPSVLLYTMKDGHV